jgi:TPR repeat protein
MNRLMKGPRRFVTKRHGGKRIIPGRPVRQVYAELFNQHCRLARQGDAGGQFEVGMMFLYGEGVPQSNREAAFWFRKAAEQGHEGARAALVLCPSATTVRPTPVDRSERQSQGMRSNRRVFALRQEVSLH